MKPSGIILLPIVMGLFVSCYVPEYDFQNFIRRYPSVTVHFIDPVTLPFDFSVLKDKYPTYGLEEDCEEICKFHNIAYKDGVYGYSIKGFNNVLSYMAMFNDRDYWVVGGGYSIDRKPSIKVSLMTEDSDSVHTKSFHEMEVTSDSLKNLISREYVSFSLSIESFKSKKCRLRVKWDVPWSDLSAKYLAGVSENVVSARWDPKALEVFYKFDYGTAINSSGEVIRNTLGMDEYGNYYSYDEGPGEDPYEEIVVIDGDEEYEDAIAAEEDDELLLENYCEEENPLISPTLLRPIYSGGRFQDNLRWRIPTFYTRVN